MAEEAVAYRPAPNEVSVAGHGSLGVALSREQRTIVRTGKFLLAAKVPGCRFCTSPLPEGSGEQPTPNPHALPYCPKCGKEALPISQENVRVEEVVIPGLAGFLLWCGEKLRNLALKIGDT